MEVIRLMLECPHGRHGAVPRASKRRRILSPLDWTDRHLRIRNLRRTHGSESPSLPSASLDLRASVWLDPSGDGYQPCLPRRRWFMSRRYCLSSSFVCTPHSLGSSDQRLQYENRSPITDSMSKRTFLRRRCLFQVDEERGKVLSRMRETEPRSSSTPRNPSYAHRHALQVGSPLQRREHVRISQWLLELSNLPEGSREKIPSETERVMPVFA